MGEFLHDEPLLPAPRGRKQDQVVEIAPPTMETALHRERKDPNNDKKASGNQAALSVEEFMEEILEG